MRVYEVDIDSLEIPDYCARVHDESQIETAVRSLDRHGQYQPVVVSGTEILCGVLIWLALKRKGARTVMVNDVGDIPLERRKEIRYLDNRIFDIETWDGERMREFLMGLDTSRLEDLGFSQKDVEALVNEEPESRRVKDFWEREEWICDNCGWQGEIRRKV